MSKEQIDEIALRVANQISPDGWLCGIDPVCEFANSLIAELAKVIEPGALVYKSEVVPNSDGWHEVSCYSKKSVALNSLLYFHPLPAPDLVAEIEEAKSALGDYICSGDDLASAIRRLVSAYKERNETAANFMSELNATEKRLESYIKEADQLRQQLSELKSLLDASLDVADAHVVTIKETEQQLSVAQADNEQLVKALEVSAEQIRRCDYTPARSTLLQAIAAHKARKEQS